jgi:hypothetical protein
MALNKSALKVSIVLIMEDMMQREDVSIDEFATRLSDTIDIYVKTATINYVSGLASASGGVVTGTFQGNLL